MLDLPNTTGQNQLEQNKRRKKMNISIMKILFEFLKNMWIVIAIIFTMPILWIVIDWAVDVIIAKIKGDNSEGKITD